MPPFSDVSVALAAETVAAGDLSTLLQLEPFGLPRGSKTPVFQEALATLTRHHIRHCAPYRRIVETLGFDPALSFPVEAQPFLPVRLFKSHRLASVDAGDVVTTLTSSGTSGQSPSMVYLDRTTAANQTKVLTRIATSFIGPKRLPLLVIDSRTAVQDRALFSARGAGILGFSMLGRDATYALDDPMQLDMDAISVFCQKHGAGRVLLFGFTYMVWEHFCAALRRRGERLALADAILFHGGGWKKLIDHAVDERTFARAVTEACGHVSVHNYYGMAEQAGSIFVACEAGYLHASIFSDVLIRDVDFNICGPGEVGLVQVLSLLPLSYPGHSLLTEDAGTLVGEDDCACGRLGKYFTVHGRIQDAEIRGCSDTASGH